MDPYGRGLPNLRASAIRHCGAGKTELPAGDVPVGDVPRDVLSLEETSEIEQFVGIAS